jgi:hypothetical protein
MSTSSSPYHLHHKKILTSSPWHPLTTLPKIMKITTSLGDGNQRQITNHHPPDGHQPPWHLGKITVAIRDDGGNT